MHWQTRDPDDLTRVATYGHDPERGLWVVLFDGGVEVAFDERGLDLSDGEDAVLAILSVMVESGFVGDWHDVEDAVRWGERHAVGSRRRPRRKLRAAIGVIRNLREAVE